MRNYELTYILPGEATEAKQKAASTKIEKLVDSLGGKINKTDSWGRKNLFYPIQKNTSGVYYFLNIELPADKAGVVNREVELDGEVIRHLLVASENHEARSTKSETKKETEGESKVISKARKEVKAKAKK